MLQCKGADLDMQVIYAINMEARWRIMATAIPEFDFSEENFRATLHMKCGSCWS